MSCYLGRILNKVLFRKGNAPKPTWFSFIQFVASNYYRRISIRNYLGVQHSENSMRNGPTNI